MEVVINLTQGQRERKLEKKAVCDTRSVVAPTLILDKDIRMQVVLFAVK